MAFYFMNSCRDSITLCNTEVELMPTYNNKPHCSQGSLESTFFAVGVSESSYNEQQQRGGSVFLLRGCDLKLLHGM